MSTTASQSSLAELLDRPADVDARVVDQDIEPAERIQDLGDHAPRPSAPTVTSAASPRVLPAGRLAITSAARWALFELAGRERHVGPGRGQRLGDRPPRPRDPPVTSATLPSSRNRSSTPPLMSDSR